MGDFSGIDPKALQGMITSFGSDKEYLRGRASDLKSRFAQLGLDVGPLTEMVGICGWLDDQLPRLQRRQGLAAAIDRTADKLHMVHIAEPVISSASAQYDGKALAERFNANHTGDRKAGAVYHEMATLLIEHRDDPDFCSAFYANLDPVIANVLPANLAEAGSPSAADDLKVYSDAFATAVSARYPAPGFDKVKQSYLEPVPGNGAAPYAWDRAAMLSYGDFPADFLAKATDANGLDQLARHPNGTYDGDRTAAAALGLPPNLIALDLQNLSRDGRASFEAVSRMGDPKNPDLQGNLGKLMTYGPGHDDVAANLGTMINVASGVHGSLDANGDWEADPSDKPSDYEQVFAFSAILAAGHTKGALQLDGSFKQDMGRLAATYAPEMLTGGHSVDEDSGPSGFEEPVPYDRIPGVDPRFYLNPGDTYLFMKTFADEDTTTAPFDEAMGKLQHDVLTAAARKDREAIEEGQQDPQTFFVTTKAFGNAQRLQYAAELRVRGEMDESQEKLREDQKIAAVGASELAGEPELPLAMKLGWRLGVFTIKEFGGTAYAESGPDRVETVNEEHAEAVNQASYTMTSALMAGGWKTTPVPQDLRGKNGGLKPYEVLLGENKLGEFDDWVNQQRSGPVPFHTKQSLSGGELSNQDADRYAQAAEEAQ